MWRALLVGAGGFVGSIGRYWVAGWAQGWTEAEFPLGTLAVNVAGSFVLGVVLAAGLERGWLHPDVRLTLAVGLCGGFTTMSTFSYETLALLQRGALGLALCNVGATLAVCLAAVWAGIAAVRFL